MKITKVKRIWKENKDTDSFFDSIEKDLVATGDLPDKSTILFYGLTGILAYKFSLIPSSEQASARTSILLASPQANPTFFNIKDFLSLGLSLDDKKKLKKVSYEYAKMDLARGETHEVEDVDENMFDDNCTVDCLPGNHKCGK